MSHIYVRQHSRSGRVVRPYVQRRKAGLTTGGPVPARRWVLPPDLEASKRRAFDEGGFLASDWRDPLLVWMTPSQFLGNAGYHVTEKEARRHAYSFDDSFDDSAAMLARRLRSGEPVDPPAKAIDLNGMEILFNGSHRAGAAVRAGIRMMPVWVFRARDNKVQRAERFRQMLDR